MDREPIWRISRIQTSNGERWVLERLRTDAVKPYYLTERIYRYEVTAGRALRAVVTTGKIPKL